MTPSVRRRPIPPAYFDSLPAQAQERTLWLEHHITEVLDGLPAGANPTASPREGYDPAKVSLQQREANKIAELEASGTPLLLKCFQRFRRGYERHGLEALIDRRAVRRRSPTGRIDPRYVELMREVLQENTTGSSRTAKVLKWNVDKRVQERFGDSVQIPSRQTFNRALPRIPEGKHATGSARTRQSQANQPRGAFGTVIATRPGEWTQIDSTPFDVGIRLDDSVSGRVDLTGLIDVATRSLVSAVLRPTTKAVDVSLLVAKAMTPEPMRPGWCQAITMAASTLPYQIMRSIDERLENAAARPIITPENIVYDNGAVYISATFRSACRTLGISMQPAHKDTPTDKPIIERNLGTVKTLFAQYVTGYLGSSIENRGKNADQQAVFSLIELQDLLDEWIVTCWQNRPHDALRDPLNPKRVLTPNEKYAALLATSGYVPVPLTGDEYVALLPSIKRVIASDGVTIDHRVYDSDALNECRGEDSGVPGQGKRWRVHYDPYDVTRIWVRNHHGEGYIPAYWRQLHTVPQPFGNDVWDHARKIAAERGERTHTEESIKAAVDDLLDRASPPPSASRRRKSAKDRRVVARAKAAAQLPPSIPEHAQLDSTPSLLAPEECPEEDIAPVIPLPVFDAEKEAETW
ncbi:integrase [Mycobacterium intracellulare subsp. chimaera]|nr:integrase [Mycobacterium intracellulare subsp. chimaera]KPN45208.1 integrase [Mycobacterium intracellulare subsp. chimaera]KPN46228.1 integrase [Mycobacterium intracellulare subsp. chimaera]